MKIAVTGASGFLGRHVLHALAGFGDVEVVATSRGTRDEDFAGGAFQYVALELWQDLVEAYDRLGRPDVVLHLAWGGLPNYRSLHHFEDELPRQYAFLKAMVEAGLPRLLVTGTCYEYGMVDGELSEDRPGLPANPYAYAKTALRQQLEFLQAKAPFALTWARLFYMYGEGQAPTSLLPQLKAAAARGDATFPMSPGEQLRDYLPVEQVAARLAMLAVSGGNHGVVNVCSGRPISIRSLVEGWIAQNGWSIAPELGVYPYPDYEPLAFWGSARKFERILNVGQLRD